MWVYKRFHRNTLLLEGGGGHVFVIAFPDQDNLSLICVCLFWPLVCSLRKQHMTIVFWYSRLEVICPIILESTYMLVWINMLVWKIWTWKTMVTKLTLHLCLLQTQAHSLPSYCHLSLSCPVHAGSHLTSPPPPQHTAFQMPIKTASLYALWASQRYFIQNNEFGSFPLILVL